MLNIAIMMTSSNGNTFRVTSHLCGEFTGPGEFPTQRPVTRSFDVYFDLRPNKRLSKLSWGWWFETLLPPLWRHRNDTLTMTSANPWHDLWPVLTLLRSEFRKCHVDKVFVTCNGSINITFSVARDKIFVKVMILQFSVLIYPQELIHSNEDKEEWPQIRRWALNW